MAAFQALSSLLGATVDELKLIFVFLISYPLAIVLKRLPDKPRWPRNTFIIATGLFYMIGVFDLWAGLRTILYSAGATYAISYYIDGSLMPWIAFVWLMGHMSINHIERQIRNDPGVVDVTGIQMVMVMKLSAFAWNVHDGRLNKDTLTAVQREKAIYKMPGFLDYTAYVLFFPSLFAGPAFDYKDYERWITTAMFDVKEGEAAAKTRPGYKIPRSGTPATKKLVEGLLWIVLFLQLGGRYYPSFLQTDDYLRYGFLRRVWYLYVLSFTSRLKYYGVWSLTEGSCILSGLGLNGVNIKTGEPMWDRLNNVNPLGLEVAQNSRGYLENWNKNTNNWLRNYIYLRVTPKGQKPGFRATLATFGTSAFWHGFYPGYYLTFILGAFAQTVAKHFRRHVRPFFLTADGKQGTSYKIYYDIFSWFVTQFGFCFITAPFVILGFNDSIVAWARVYFYCIVGVAITLGFFNSPGKVMLHKQLEKRSHPETLKRTASERSMATLGLPDMDDVDQAIDEIKAEVNMRKRRGSKVEFPSGEELKRAVTQRVWLKRQDSGGAGGDVKLDLDTLQRRVTQVIDQDGLDMPKTK